MQYFDKITYLYKKYKTKMLFLQIILPLFTLKTLDNDIIPLYSKKDSECLIFTSKV
jgi:hypothetical protein